MSCSVSLTPVLRLALTRCKAALGVMWGQSCRFQIWKPTSLCSPRCLPLGKQGACLEASNLVTEGRQLNPRMEKLVVFDFDHTLIDCNSDTWLVKKLGSWELMKSLRDVLPWTALMDKMMTELHNCGRSLSDFEECLKTCPLHPAMLEAVQFAAASGCELQIVSDANSWFIDTILQAHGIRHLFSHIHTNPAHVDPSGVLRILPFHPCSDMPHNCPLCPPNMCKGSIMDKILDDAHHRTRKQVVYLGDGRGDFCPALRLKGEDYVLPRSGFPLSKLLDASDGIKCHVHPWNSAGDVAVLLKELLSSQSTEKGQ